jgi:hypothetical protein
MTATLNIEIPSRLRHIPEQTLKKSLTSFLRDYTFPDFRPLDPEEITPELLAKAEVAQRVPTHLLSNI